MKVFAIVTACVLAAGGGAYYFHSCDTCPLTGYPVAKTGGCCSTDNGQPSCCTLPCPACSDDCLECCATCEQCCEAGAAVPTAALSANVTAEEDCCAACSSPAHIATAAAIAGVTLK
jgi:hypothetical protein